MQRQETVAANGWAGLPVELMDTVLEALQAARRSEPQEEVDPLKAGWVFVRPPPWCGWCALAGRPFTMRW
jgi:hypothetical protein